jgi:protein involved in polysaccharide export with SLBB domain
MRNIKPNGRVILNLGSENTTFTDLPQFALENGDTIFVPTRPDVINVVGQVYNPGTYIYNSHYGAGKYINLAGNENPYADSSQEYILRADGTLYSRQQAGWFGGFNNQRLNPGDVIVVPQQIQFGSGMQFALNMTQILANSAQVLAIFGMYR